MPTEFLLRIVDYLQKEKALKQVFEPIFADLTAQILSNDTLMGFVGPTQALELLVSNKLLAGVVSSIRRRTIELNYLACKHGAFSAKNAKHW